MKEYLLRPFPDEDEVARFVAHCDAALERRLEEVAEELAGETGIRMIGLTGPTCSGKTTTLLPSASLLRVSRKVCSSRASW